MHPHATDQTDLEALERRGLGKGRCTVTRAGMHGTCDLVDLPAYGATPCGGTEAAGLSSHVYTLFIQGPGVRVDESSHGACVRVCGERVGTCAQPRLSVLCHDAGSHINGDMNAFIFIRP